MYLGRIITNSKSIDTFNFIEVTNNKNLINEGIPTLIVGKKIAEDIFGNNIHYLNRKIDNNISWTFGKTERRNEFEKDLKEFNSSIIKKLNKCVNYHYFNIFTESFSSIKQLVNLFNSSMDKVVFISVDHIYVYYNGSVIGLSLNDTSYIGLSRNKILNKIKSNIHNKIITNEYFLDSKVKKIINGNKILIPYMFFLQNQ